MEDLSHSRFLQFNKNKHFMTILCRFFPDYIIHVQDLFTSCGYMNNWQTFHHILTWQTDQNVIAFNH
jgi:hypothetical protein